MAGDKHWQALASGPIGVHVRCSAPQLPAAQAGRAVAAAAPAAAPAASVAAARLPASACRPGQKAPRLQM